MSRPPTQAHRSPAVFSHSPSNDPYRAMRKSTTPDSTETSHASERGPEHSRTPSESSTGRLATTTPYDPYDDYQDPYAARGKMRRADSNTRVNSYLPYSHYRRDPLAVPEPLALEDDDRLQSFVSSPSQATGSKGIGSLLPDNMIMDKMMEPASTTASSNAANRNKATHSTASMLESLPEELKRRRKRRRWWSCCGIRPRTMVLVALISIAVIIVVWYFVWPRWAQDIDFLSLGLTTLAINSNTTYDAMWELNLTMSNADNWVPTQVKQFSATVLDGNTNVQVGEGASGSMVLPPRTADLTVSVPLHVHYTSDNPNDVTLMDLMTCKVINAESGTHQGINLVFQVEQRIAGIAWTQSTQVHPSMVTCPQ